MKRRSRPSTYDPALSRRLTPAEVVQHWFRRGAAYAETMHAEHPNFPPAGPDGLYLAAQVAAWFDKWHGVRVSSIEPDDEAAALEIARGTRQNPPLEGEAARQR